MKLCVQQEIATRWQCVHILSEVTYKSSEVAHLAYHVAGEYQGIYCIVHTTVYTA